jgi:7,8-dihydropterin-6-yl-methyl-4-(beta-D-ribofuranosyl)aminobenzene 5'-phosphate synthase
VKITTLVENLAGEGLGCAHGLSLFVETDRHRILFDAGPDGALLLKNAATLGIDLTAADIAVLSHGHYDHAGGFSAFLEHNPGAHLYIQSEALRGHFALEKDGWRNIGVDPNLTSEYADRLVRTGEQHIIDGELHLFSDIHTRELFSQSNNSLYEETETGKAPDRYVHEQNLLIRSSGASVLLAGCAHRGIVNVLRRAEELLGYTPDYVLAGFHLTNPGLETDEPEPFVRAVGAELRKRDAVFITGHCTGLAPYAILKEMLGERMRYMSTGTVFDL